jgi:hypothetical protein
LAAARHAQRWHPTASDAGSASDTSASDARASDAGTAGTRAAAGAASASPDLATGAGIAARAGMAARATDDDAAGADVATCAVRPPCPSGARTTGARRAAEPIDQWIELSPSAAGNDDSQR